MTTGVAAPSLWRHPPFVRLWVASVGSHFGFEMLSLVVGWQVYSITGRALDLGLIGLVQFVPSLLLALPAGHAADRYDRRRIVQVAQVVIGLAAAALAVLTVTGRLHETGVFAILFVIGVATAFEFPAQKSLLPTLVPPASCRARWR